MAIKKFPHAVIYNGIFYPPNAEIKCTEEKDAIEKSTEEKPKKRGAK